MKELIQKSKVPIIIFVVLFLLFVAYNVFIKSEDSDSLVEYALSEVSETRQQLDKDILPLLILVKNVQFDGALFADPTFQSLADFSKPIEPEDKGRENPFAGNLVGPSDSSNQGALLFSGGTASSTSKSTTPTRGVAPSDTGTKPPGEF
jgi:hypothetical protein